MEFLDLQTKFVSLHLDNRTEWGIAGTKNKEIINYALKEVFQKFINTIEGQKLMKEDKTEISITDGEGNLPADFYCLSQSEDSKGVYLKYQGGYTNSNIDYNIIFGSPYKIIFNKEPLYDVYIDYIKKITTLIDTDDVPAIPEVLHENILDFAMVEYFRHQRDWQNLSAAMQFAEGRMQEKITQLWFN